MGEINEREEELAKSRSQLSDLQEENRLMQVSTEKYRQQMEILQTELVEKEKELNKALEKLEEQSRLISNLSMTAKNQRSITGNFGGECDGQMMERA
jgi:chromosome segregation ATPase